MNGIIAFIAEKVPFIKKLWDSFSGYKEYLAGFGMMLSGIAGCLTIIAVWISQLTYLKDLAAVLTWAQSLKHDPASAALIVAWAGVLQGLKVLGARHAADKAAIIAPAQPVAELPAPVVPPAPPVP